MNALTALGLTLVVFLLLGVPVAWTLIAAGAAAILAGGGTPLMIIPQQISPASTACCCWRSRSSCWLAT